MRTQCPNCDPCKDCDDRMEDAIDRARHAEREAARLANHAIAQDKIIAERDKLIGVDKALERDNVALSERVSALETALKQEETAADRTIWNLTQENIRLRAALESAAKNLHDAGRPKAAHRAELALQSRQVSPRGSGSTEPKGTPEATSSHGATPDAVASGITHTPAECREFQEALKEQFPYDYPIVVGAERTQQANEGAIGSRKGDHGANSFTAPPSQSEHVSDPKPGATLEAAAVAWVKEHGRSGGSSWHTQRAFMAGAEWWYANARYTQEEIDEANAQAKELGKVLGVGEQAEPATHVPDIVKAECKKCGHPMGRCSCEWRA